MPEHFYIILSPRLFVYPNDINYNQQFDTKPDDVEGYHHAVSHQHYEIYFRIDHDSNIISFRLGPYQKTMKLVQSHGWAWKVQRTQIKCTSSENLEKSWTDPFWAGRIVDIGWKVLGIPKLV